MLKIELVKQPTIQAHLVESKKWEQLLNREMLLKQLSSLRLLLWQGLALRGHDEKEGNLMQLLMVHTDDCSILHW